MSAGSTATPTAPAQIAKAALRRLAQAQQEPTPENFARAYAEESGTSASALPRGARPLLDLLASRVLEGDAERRSLAHAVERGDWAGAQRLVEASAGHSPWAGIIERVARGVERGGRQWTAARKKDSLQRVLDGSRRDAGRLQQRLLSLLQAWDDDRSADAEGDGAVVPAADAAGAVAVAAATAPWPDATGHLARTVRAALPEAEPRALELADELAALADRLARDGADASTVAQIDATCQQARRWLAHRHQLFDALGRLCLELGEGLTELAEDRSWARGQGEALQARLAHGINARAVRAASELLAEARVQQHRIRGERDAARDALKGLIQRMLSELGALDAHTDRFEQSVGRHAEAIERADSLEGLAGVVRELVDESRAVQAIVHQTRERLHSEHAKADELESRVRELEGELRRLSDEVSTDALTQVANRRGLMQAFETEVARLAREQGTVLTVGLIDIDNFKKLNDTLGHAAGDTALKTLAAAVHERLRPVDTVARFGGEEFVLLLPQTAVAEGQQTVTRLQRSLSASLFLHEGREVFVTFSAGVTQWRPGETLDAALERADEALYEAKRTGKNRTCVA